MTTREHDRPGKDRASGPGRTAAKAGPKSGACRACVATVKMGAKTDLGRVRDNNEDKFDFFEPEDPAVLATKGCFYAVADGMGGHSAGQIACELALKTVIAGLLRQPVAGHGSQPAPGGRERRTRLIYDTAQAIPDRQGMGTTLTAAVVREDRLTIAQVGDSRAYLLRDGHDHADHRRPFLGRRAGAAGDDDAGRGAGLALPQHHHPLHRHGGGRRGGRLHARASASATHCCSAPTA